jgi:outer membrane protein OmpA-like peptidoglycan-associated protein
VRVVPKLRILREQEHVVSVAVIPAFTLPTASSTTSYLGEGGGFTFAPELAISRGIGGLRLGLDLGYRLRDEKRFADLQVGQELFTHLGVGYRLHDVGVPLELDASVHAALGLDRPLARSTETPVELLGGATYDVWGPLQAFVDVGGGVVRGFGAPVVRVIAGVRYAPRAPVAPSDRDGDGIPDTVDQCPDAAEDKDGFEDDDGCPDLDNDHDGIPDVADKCPDAAEDKDGFEDDDGCPDLDNDQDGIPDADDKCPNVAGPKDHQGCPILDRDKDGIEDSADKCPDVAGIAALQGCPEPDTDGDGILDKEDLCPTVKGVASAKGCPDADGDGIVDNDDACPKDAGLAAFKGCPDRDHDGIPDNVDKCPDEPETINGFQDDDGCPDKGESKVKITATKVEILDKVYFDTDKSTIQKRSFGLLSQVAAILRANPQVTQVRVEGHTDSQGQDAHNLQLSKDRAAAVRTYLLGKGIDEARLVSEGYGKTRPAADNATAKGREKNRRVEFTILDIDGKPVASEPTPPAPAR